MAVTIYDIAKKAGCSPSAVSLAINNSKKVSEATRQRVLRIASELGYTPNFSARSLKRSQTHMIGVIAPNLDNPLFCTMISGITHVANNHGYSIVLGLSAGSLETEKYNINMLSERRVDGLIVFPSFPDFIFPSFIDGIDNKKIPLVLCGLSNKSKNAINYVKCDNHKGGYIATEHLIKNGCNKIACICATNEKTQASSRIAGYKQAHNNYGIFVDENLILFCSTDSQSIYDSTIDFVKKYNVDGIFCLYDFMALPVMRAVLSLGKRIPEDVAIIGYDNIDLSSNLVIPLSSVKTHAYEVGSLATEKLISEIKDPDFVIQPTVFEPELIVRQSSDKSHLNGHI